MVSVSLVAESHIHFESCSPPSSRNTRLMSWTLSSWIELTSNSSHTACSKSVHNFLSRSVYGPFTLTMMTGTGTGTVAGSAGDGIHGLPVGTGSFVGRVVLSMVRTIIL